MRLEAFKITDAVSGELRPQHLPAVVPHGAVGREDAVTQELAPFLAEGLALAKVGKLRGQNSLDIVRVNGEDDAFVGNASFNRVAPVALEELIAPNLHCLVSPYGAKTSGHYVQACAQLDMLAGSGGGPRQKTYQAAPSFPCFCHNYRCA